MNEERMILIELCKKHASDYPGIDGVPDEKVTLGSWELMWAISATIEGTNGANAILHKIILNLSERLGMSINDLLDLEKEIRDEIH